jgi:hypothetical protein
LPAGGDLTIVRGGPEPPNGFRLFWKEERT